MILSFVLHPISGILGLVQTGLQIVALIFLFQQRSSDWFQYKPGAKCEMLAEPERSGSTSDTNPRPESDLDDEQSWAAALSEYESGNRRDGLYAKLYAKLDGDESKIKVAYMKTRVVEMTEEAQKRSALAKVRARGHQERSGSTSDTNPRSESEMCVDEEGWVAWYFGWNVAARTKRQMLAEAKRSEPT
jgi:hypothetical protein